MQSAATESDVESLYTFANELNAMDSKEAEAVAKGALGTAHYFTGEWPQALENYQSALEIFVELNDFVAASRVTMNLGNVHYRVHEYDEAVEHYQRAMMLLERQGDRSAMGDITGCIGSVFYQTGDYEQAIRHYRMALAAHKEVDNHKGEAMIASNLSSVYHGISNYTLALEYADRALALYEKADNRRGMARALEGIGAVHSSTGDYPLALQSFRKSLALSEALGDRTHSALISCNIGVVFQRAGNYDKAMEYYHSSMTIYQELNDMLGLAEVSNVIGTAYNSTGEFLQALEHYRRALATNRQLGNQNDVAINIGNLIGPLLKLEHFTEAASLLNELEEMVLDDIGTQVQVLVYKAEIAEHNGNLDTAHQYLMDSVTRAIEGNFSEGAAGCHLLLRDLAQKRNDFAGYITHNTEYTRISEEIRGKDVTRNLTMMEAEHQIEAEMRERDKERAILYSTLPKHVADRIVRGEKVSGDHFEHATVLFTDIVGFTSHSSSMDPSDVVVLLEQLFAYFETLCEKHGVTKVKTMGDSFMCFKGDATAEENAVAVARAALAMSKPTLTWPNGDVLSIRVGIHSGPATAGIIGTQRLQYDVWGDTVNVASRLESTSEPGRIHVSDAFARVIPNEVKDPASNAGIIPNEVRVVRLILRGETELKGKGRLTTYWLVDG